MPPSTIARNVRSGDGGEKTIVRMLMRGWGMDGFILVVLVRRVERVCGKAGGWQGMEARSSWWYVQDCSPYSWGGHWKTHKNGCGESMRRITENLARIEWGGCGWALFLVRGIN